MMVLC